MYTRIKKRVHSTGNNRKEKYEHYFDFASSLSLSLSLSLPLTKFLHKSIFLYFAKSKHIYVIEKECRRTFGFHPAASL